MSIKNIRKSVETNSSEDRLKNKLYENYSRFINEAEGDEDELDLGGDEETLDLDLGGDAGGDELADGDVDLDMEGGADEPEMGLNAIENLEDTEKARVDDWVSDLLSDSLETNAIDDEDSLDAEASADSLDPMGETQYIHDDLPITVDELENIIDSDDSLAALEAKLAELAMSAEDEDAIPGDEDNMDLSDDMDMDMNDEGGFPAEETEEVLEDDEEDNLLDESHDPMSGINKYFDQGFEGEDVKDELTEDVELAPASKEEGFKKVSHGLNDQITSTVKNTDGAGEPVDTTAIIKEARTKSAMVVKAAIMIERMQKEVAKLKLENYKLIKTNGLLSVAGDMLNADTRNKISEGFDKCDSVEQVNKFYGKITEKLKSAARPSLNEAVTSRKTKINVLKEAVEQKEVVSMEQQRKNMLMGLPTNDDVYFQN